MGIGGGGLAMNGSYTASSAALKRTSATAVCFQTEEKTGAPKGTEQWLEQPIIAGLQSPLQHGPSIPWSCIGQGSAKACSVADAKLTADPSAKPRTNKNAMMWRFTSIRNLQIRMQNALLRSLRQYRLLEGLAPQHYEIGNVLIRFERLCSRNRRSGSDKSRLKRMTVRQRTRHDNLGAFGQRRCELANELIGLDWCKFDLRRLPGILCNCFHLCPC